MQITPITDRKTYEKSALATAGAAFEALILEKMIASARRQGAGDDLRALGERQLAENLARTSPLGIARLLEK